MFWRRVVLLAALTAVLAAAQAVPSSSSPSSFPTPIHGVVADALGRRVAGATVTVADARGHVLAQTRTDAQGEYELTAPAGAVAIAARKPGLAPASTTVAAHPAPLVLPLATVQTAVNVTALGVPLPEAQVGNTTSTISAAQLQVLRPVQAATALRTTPGVGVIQSGETGGVVSVFLRGAPAEFTQVLLDGIPIQRLDLGGYDFSNLMAGGIDEMQILRGPDSVIYGSDAAAGVIALRTRRGTDVESSPELDGDTEFGAYGTALENNQLLGNWRRFDYAFRYGYFDTRNQQPYDKFRNNTYGANISWRPDNVSSVRFDLDRSYSFTGQPNAVGFYGLPEQAFKHQGETYGRLSWQRQFTPRWREQLDLSQESANLFSENPAAVGTPDGFGDYDGLPVTIQGANGYTVQGTALMGYGTYPQYSPSDTLRRDVDWNSQLNLAPGWSLIGGYRYYDERGLSATNDFSRHDSGVYAALSGGLWNRVFANGGVSVDWNTPFGRTANPQFSLAWFPRLSTGGFWDETRLRTSAGTALKDPSLIDEAYSLYQELASTPGGAASAQRLGVTPLHPQRARDFDAGLDQYLDHGRAMVSLTWFDQRYYDLIEDIPTTAFPALGIPAAVAQTAAYGGEYNSLTERARGLELEAHFRGGTWMPWRIDGSYTATAAKVLRSFSFDAQSPSYNPQFPGIAIGAYAPLVGQRPFRVPPQTASLVFTVSRGPITSSLSGSYMSRRNDSTFLSDSSFGNTLLLPNRNLDAAVTLVNWTGGYRLNPSWQLVATVDNLFNSHDQQVIGFPAPGISARMGVLWTWSPDKKMF